MASEWRHMTVEQLAAPVPSALSTGPFGSSISSRFFRDTGVPVIRGSNLSEDVGIRLSNKGLAFVSPEKAREYSRSIVRPGDLIFTCWGTIGQIGLIAEDSIYQEYVISNKQMKLTPNADLADSLFLYYAFSEPGMQSEITNQAIGSSVPGFNLGQLRVLRILLPPLAEQQAIARILGALDDKIELNRRMNETLEATARALFQSWFVDFDPVRAKAEGRPPAGMDAATAALFPDGFEQSPLGLIPRGWRVGALAEIADITMGQSPPGETYNEAGVGAPFYQGIRDFTARFPSRRVYCTAPTRFAEAGDVLFSVRAPVGSLNVAVERCAIGRGVAALRLKSAPQGFLLYLLMSNESEWSKFEAGGTVFGSVSKDDISTLRVLIPDECLVSEFGRLVEPIDARYLSNEMQSRTLAATRDALLPKLLSGEVRVAEAERVVEEVKP